MLSDYAPSPTLAVSDVDRARAFYEGVLGFVENTDDSVPDGVVYSAGDESFLVYASDFAGTNQATAMSFQVPEGEFDAEIAKLRDNGITFQTFETDEDTVWADGIATMGDMRSVWFTDPDGNILNIETSSIEVV
ncbi:VOC family protein [Cellulomonas sp. P22]|uniref:VOC family protein n=1 Tax=Cellulomonas sp. P22 TaxID=3373189 RepID=UPI003798D563